MKQNKKGFTLIEIIVCIVLIVLISGVTTVSIVQKSIKTDEKLFDRVVNSALVYISTERDEIGNTYEVGINKGGEGVIIPLEELYNTGYLEDNDYDVLVKQLKDEDEYVIVGYKNEEECKTGGVEVTAGWVDKTTYICGFSNSNPSPSQKKDLYSIITNLEYNTNCDKSSSASLCLLHGSASNTISDPNSDGTYDDIYYFKGGEVNNYLKINGLEDIFRIVRTTENQNLKIVDDDSNLIKNDLYVRGAWNTVINGIYTWTGKNYPEIEMDGYKVLTYKTSDKNSGLYNCSDEDNTSSWDDDKVISCLHYTGRTTKEIYSPIYQYIYKPLLERYNSISSSLEQYLDTEYKWCTSKNTSSSISSVSFKCSKQKTRTSNFGLLNIFEYKNIQTIINTPHAGQDDDQHQYFYSRDLGIWACSDTTEFAFGTTDYEFLSTLNNHPDIDQFCLSDDNFYMRTAYVIKGNSKVIDGDGTEEKPYIIDGFVN